MDKINIDKQKIDEILDRGIISEILPTKKEFQEKLVEGKKLKFYMGFDPTAKSLHLGHSQGLMLLEDFRELGHEVIFLIGDFTGMIGDPTDKGAARVRQTRKDVEKNFKGWLEQTKNILSFNDKKNPVQVKYNADWLGKLSFSEVIDLASNFTVQQMLERDMFKNRLKEGKPIHLHEFMYPLMQGYDSVALDVDVELCGTDQIFNALAGRTLLKKLKNKDKFVVAANLIADEKTGQLMSKSAGTGIFLDLSSNDLYGAVMAQSDGMIRPLFIGCTRVSVKDVEENMKLENPRDAKMKLAFEITKIYHGEKAAKEAEEHFIKTVQKKEIPDEIESMKLKVESINILDLLVETKLVSSKGDARRMIKQNAIKIDGEVVSDEQLAIKISSKEILLQRGKRQFIKVVK